MPGGVTRRNHRLNRDHGPADERVAVSALELPILAGGCKRQRPSRGVRTGVSRGGAQPGRLEQAAMAMAGET